MLENFPIIHTNIWDAVIAVPLVVILTQIIKLIFRIRSPFVPTVANVIGLVISIFLHIAKIFGLAYLWDFFTEMLLLVYMLL